VVLYELLVGALPLDIKALRKIALGEVLRAIRFWLTARRRGLAGNGQYCGKRLLSCPAI
jgi:hypothetical protein